MITKVKTKTHEEWLEERKKSLGGSDVGAVLGMNTYTSAYTVWAEKTGKIPSFEGNEWTRLGNDLEYYVAERFCEKSGLKVSKDTATWRNSKYPHLHANIDRKIVGMKAGLECKLTSEFNAIKYKNGEFPDRFYAQCVAYLTVTEFERWYLAVLIYGKGIKIYQMTRIPNDTVPEWCDSSVYVEEGEIETLARVTKDFWDNCVLANTPPATDGSRSTNDALKAIYPESNGDSVSLMAYEGDLKQYMTYKALEDDVKKQKDEVANRIKAFMGEASSGNSNYYKVSWASSVRNTFDHKRFAKDNPGIDLSAYFNQTQTRTFTVKEI